MCSGQKEKRDVFLLPLGALLTFEVVSMRIVFLFLVFFLVLSPIAGIIIRAGICLDCKANKVLACVCVWVVWGF